MSRRSRQKLLKKKLIQIVSKPEAWSNHDEPRLDDILVKLPPEDRQWLGEYITALQERRRRED